MDALHLFRAVRDANEDVPDNPDTVVAAIGKLKQSMISLTAEVANQVGFR